jgi:hypothetical protein
MAQGDHGVSGNANSSPLLGATKDKDESSDAKSEQDANKDEDKKNSSKDKDKSEESTEATVDAADAPFVEEKNTNYKLIGARFRMTLIPQFMFGLFGADGGKTMWSPQVGPELAIRRNGFEYDLWLTYASYSMGNAPFKASNDPDTAYEIVSSSIKTISVGSDFLWSAPINPRLQFVYGGGVGIGVVFGDLNRTQSYPPGGSRDPNAYVPCKGPLSPDPTYCGNDNSHYPGYKESSWINGGSKPIVFPWIAPFQMGLRWKPAPKIAIRLDAGFAFPGPFFFGLSGQHGLF